MPVRTVDDPAARAHVGDASPRRPGAGSAPGVGSGASARVGGWGGLLGVAGGLLLACVGCQQAPITEDDERTQFDRYDLVRDQFAPAYLEDEYGRKRPNLRGRLIETR